MKRGYSAVRARTVRDFQGAIERTKEKKRLQLEIPDEYLEGYKQLIEDAIIRGETMPPEGKKCFKSRKDHHPSFDQGIFNTNQWFESWDDYIPFTSKKVNTKFGIKQEALNYYYLLVSEPLKQPRAHVNLVDLVVEKFKGRERRCRPLSQTTSVEEQSLREIIKEDLVNSYITDYLVEGDRFLPNSFAKRHGFTSSTELIRSFKQEQKQELHDAILKVYEAKYRADGKVNVTDLCMHAGISTSTFYRVVKAKENSMKEFKNKLDKKIEEARQRPIKLRRERNIRRGLAAAAGLALTFLQLTDTFKERYTPQDEQYITRYAEQPKESALELASL